MPLVFGAFFLFLLSKLHSASIINGGMNGDLKGEKKPGGFKKKKRKKNLISQGAAGQRTHGEGWSRRPKLLPVFSVSVS